MASTAFPFSATYWRLVRAPRYSVSFAFPLLAAYEVLAFVLSQFEVAGVRNGADVLLKSLFLALGGRRGVAAFGAVVVGGGLLLVWRDLRKSGGVRPRYFLYMAAESVAYAMVFGGVAATLTGLLLPFTILVGRVSDVGEGTLAGLGLPTQLMISLGAGIYEELLFRVLLVSGLTLVASRIFHWRRGMVSLVAVVTAALIFAAFHYIGPYGEPLALGSFLFRTIAGLLFSGLYVLRGFGITAWTHALYDVFLAVGR